MNHSIKYFLFSFLLSQFISPTWAISDKLKNLSTIDYSPIQDGPLYFWGECTGKVSETADLKGVGLSNVDLEKGIECVSGDFDGNGYLDFSLRGPKSEDPKSSLGDYKIVFFKNNRIIHTDKIRTLNTEFQFLTLYPAGYSKHTCPHSLVPGLVSWGEGDLNTIYLFNTKKKEFEIHECPSEGP